MSTQAVSDGPSALLDDLTARLNAVVGDLRSYLATPEGRELRKRIAQFAIIAAPLLFRMKFFRATPVGRVLGLVGGAAIVVKLAEALRDWEPVVDLEPV